MSITNKIKYGKLQGNIVQSGKYYVPKLIISDCREIIMNKGR